MRHIEASAKIVTTTPIDAAAVKYSLVQRLKGAFHVETVGEGNENFSVVATGKATSYVFHLGVVIKCESDRIRVLIDGGNDISMGTKIFYVLSLLAVLGISFFPGALGNSGLSVEAMGFLVVGGFIIYDTNRKTDEPQLLLERILRSLEAEYG